MGKKQHQQDKLYLTNKERLLYGGKSSFADLNKELLQRFKRLPFGMCCLSFQPYVRPYCNKQGYIFDLENIVKFVDKHKIDPISGEKADLKQHFFKLNMSKNEEGKYQCPVIFKEFSENSHIVAVRTTGNVYSFEAVDELNFKAKNLKDLISDEPFARSDVITLQEPAKNLEKQDISKFYYLQNNLKWNDADELADKDGKANLNSINQIMKATLDEMNKEERKSETNKELMSSEIDEVHRRTAATDRFNAANYSTGAVGASLTSTAMVPIGKLEAAHIGDDAYRYSQISKKGYVQLKTNFGPLNFELYCHQTPKACENFIKLCKSSYYDNTKFHRLIKYFILQGGDPTATGKGGQSYWGKPFEDEFNNSYSHDRRGVLSMANAGRNTNKSQFFITFKPCKYLDKKHTIFGHLVGGFETLDKIEQMPVDKLDRPVQDLLIESTSVFVDPFAEVDEKLEHERRKAAEVTKEPNEDRNKRANKGELSERQLESCKRKIGALIDLDKLSKVQKETNGANVAVKRKAAAGELFGNFSSW